MLGFCIVALFSMIALVFPRGASLGFCGPGPLESMVLSLSLRCQGNLGLSGFWGFGLMMKDLVSISQGVCGLLAPSL